MLSKEKGYIEMTQPDKPNRQSQQYRLTSKGLRALRVVELINGLGFMSRKNTPSMTQPSQPYRRTSPYRLPKSGKRPNLDRMPAFA